MVRFLPPGLDKYSHYTTNALNKAWGEWYIGNISEFQDFQKEKLTILINRETTVELSLKDHGCQHDALLTVLVHSNSKKKLIINIRVFNFYNLDNNIQIQCTGDFEANNTKQIKFEKIYWHQLYSNRSEFLSNTNYIKFEFIISLTSLENIPKMVQQNIHEKYYSDDIKDIIGFLKIHIPYYYNILYFIEETNFESLINYLRICFVSYDDINKSTNPLFNDDEITKDEFIKVVLYDSNSFETYKIDHTISEFSLFAIVTNSYSLVRSMFYADTWFCRHQEYIYLTIDEISKKFTSNGYVQENNVIFAVYYNTFYYDRLFGTKMNVEFDPDHINDDYSFLPHFSLMNGNSSC